MPTIHELYAKIETMNAEISAQREILYKLELERELLEETIDALTELDNQDEAPY